MAFTRVDCDFYAPRAGSGPPAAYVALNPGRKPGSVVIAGSSATRKSLGAQVACKLSLDHFTEGVLDHFEEHPAPLTTDLEISQAVLEAAFKRANTSVYDFGHKLAAGGRLAASLIGLVIEDSVVAAGRVGEWSAYLLRRGVLYPFFDDSAAFTEATETDDRFVGAKSLVTIETATVPVEAADVIFIVSALLTDQQIRLLSIAAEDYVEEAKTSAWLSEQLFPEDSDIGIVLTAAIGPDAIYLANAVD